MKHDAIRKWKQQIEKSDSKMRTHACLPRKIRKILNEDAVFYCPCGLAWMSNGRWERAEYELRYLNGPQVWSIWLRRYRQTEIARMPMSATREEAKAWARALLLRDNVEIIKFSSYGSQDAVATTYAIHYAPIINGLRAIARSEMP